jgi:hypothetical protein
MPVILATQEAELRASWFKVSPGKIVHKTLLWTNPSQKRDGGVAQGVGPEFKPHYRKKQTNQKSYIGSRRKHEWTLQSDWKERNPMYDSQSRCTKIKIDKFDFIKNTHSKRIWQYEKTNGKTVRKTAISISDKEPLLLGWEVVSRIKVHYIYVWK